MIKREMLCDIYDIIRLHPANSRLYRLYCIPIIDVISIHMCNNVLHRSKKLHEILQKILSF